MHLTVAAALIVDPQGRVLCVRRGASRFASTAHKWEFPGGKLEPGETPAQAAVREVREELGLEIEALGDAPVAEHDYPEFSIALHGVLCAPRDPSAVPVLREHEAMDWCSPDALWKHDFAEADMPLLLWLKERAFGAALRTETFGRYPVFLDACASTNDELLRRAEAGAPEGTLVVAERQSAGRGRLGRSWLAEPGQGLLFSLLTRPALPPEVAATVPLVAGLAVAQTLRGLGFEAGLKWPNDVLLGDRKACGILCEAQTSAQGIEGIVVGVGLNVASVPEAVSWRAAGLGAGLDRLDLLARLCAAFEALYGRWRRGGLAVLRPELDALDAKRGKPILVRLGDAPREGIARGIREDGALLLETPEGMEPLLCGEIVQWD